MYSLKKIFFYSKNALFRAQSLKQYFNLLHESKLSETERQDLIFNKVKSIVIHAYNSNDFYKKKFDKINFNPNNFHDISTIKKIPILTKSELREENLLINNFDKNLLYKSTTGGSTGVPVSVFHDKSFKSEVFGWFILKIWGAHISDNAGFLERYNPSKGIKGIINKIIWYSIIFLIRNN